MIAEAAGRLEIPRRLRALVRARESSLIGLAALVGAIAGVVVAVMGEPSISCTRFFSNWRRASGCRGGSRSIRGWRFWCRSAGGILFGIAAELIRRWRPDREIDPIEANALHGGRMSLIGSMIVAAADRVVERRRGLGRPRSRLHANVGGIASRIGNAFRLRRGDLRILVGCGAAAGIAGAFGAPLAGAFYGFELIIGSYSPISLAPVGISSLIGFLVAHYFSPAELGVVAPEKTTIVGPRSGAGRDARICWRRCSASFSCAASRSARRCSRGCGCGRRCARDRAAWSSGCWRSCRRR